MFQVNCYDEDVLIPAGMVRYRPALYSILDKTGILCWGASKHEFVLLLLLLLLYFSREYIISLLALCL
eukprot:COSAG05_NODE_134_length_17060_cov_9.767761_6_plen_68_part_00